MLKRIFKKNGDLNMLELFKIIILNFFIIEIVSLILNKTLIAANASITLAIISNIIIIAQLIAYSKSLYEEILELIQSFKIKQISLKNIFKIDYIKIKIFFKEVKLPNYKSYKKLSVIRC